MSQIQFLQIVIFAAIAAIAFGIFTTNKILSLPKGTKRMITISGAIQEGAKAYLNRQYTTIAIVGIVIFFAFFFNTFYPYISKIRPEEHDEKNSKKYLFCGFIYFF